jgi:hypothetical protein
MSVKWGIAVKIITKSTTACNCVSTVLVVYMLVQRHWCHMLMICVQNEASDTAFVDIP